jgi:hypothetical protein
MAPLHSKKLRQLGGIGVLVAYLLAQAWWLTSMSPDDTDDDTLVWLLAGAPVAFATGWLLLPLAARWINPGGSKRRKHRHRRQHTSSVSTRKSDGAV